MQLAVPAGKKTSRSTPTGHPAATLSCGYHFHPIFQPSPLRCQRPPSQALPLLLVGTVYLSFQTLFFSLQKERLSVHQALSSSAEMLFARA